MGFSLKVGIVGLPNVGKSTLFNALLKKQQALAANYPFATIEPNIGVVPVPDERLEQLAELVANESRDPSTPLGMTQKPPLVPATVRFVDIAGLVKGASKGEGLGNQFLSHIREVDAIVQVVRNFTDENVIRAGAVNPDSDIETVNTELILADLQSIENQKSKISASGGKNQSASRRTKVKSGDEKEKIKAIDKLEIGLNQGLMVREVDLTDHEKGSIKDINFLTAKPLIYVINIDTPEGSGSLDLDSKPEGLGLFNPSGLNGPAISVCAKLEAELSELTEDEQEEYLKELGITERGLNKVIRAAYDILGLQTYFTAGPKEIRAWTINKGDTAPVAAGKIHTDFERGFIAAEVISTEELLVSGSYKSARDLGKIRLEGRDYIVTDGDVIEFRFSV